MKLNQFSSAVSILLLFALISCSKNDHEDRTPDRSNFSTTLMKVYEIDSTKATPNDTIGRWFFAYDQANRLTSDSSYSTGQNGGPWFSQVKVIEYKASDTLPFRSIAKSYSSSGQGTADTTYYTYANGVCIADTVIYRFLSDAASTAGSRNNYTFMPGVVIREFQNWIPGWNNYSAVEHDTIYQTISNGNIIRQGDTLYTFVNGNFSGTQVFETTVSYLPNPNPFFKINNTALSKRYFTGIGIGNYSIYTYAPPRLVSEQVSNWGRVKYDYIFRADGYPLSAKVTLQDSRGRMVTKLLFEYARN